MRTFLRFLFRSTAWVALAALLVCLYGFFEARRDPVIKQGRMELADWPKGAPPIRMLLLSDIHLGNATMGTARLDRIVDQAMAQKPDLILLAGDFISGYDAQTARAVSPDLTAAMARLHAPLGVIAVLGNHDYWTDAATVRRTLSAAKVDVLVNEAIQRGPLVIGGVNDKIAKHDDVPKTEAAMRKLKGANIILAHSPDIARISRFGSQPVFAGHTHCGQIVVPWFGPLRTMIDHREQFPCGISHQGHHAMIVTGGVGTSILPMRIGAPPEMWVVTLGPRDANPASKQ
ncbi:phosphohydrolase [Sphingomonas sp. So64.6b]|uniref:metallophosphoesterase n=1 Tax=Sphingomonas sp. So64.6b TaxID=2997354 RepID=UPI0015FF56C7|nr:metallophosphoesterase [Sphingomonas sp. So64.6b]QNA86040.1 phosphohydrolase [Sphingomonas sp. So64.6b]